MIKANYLNFYGHFKSIQHTIYFTGKDFILQRSMINEEYVFHPKGVVTLFQNSVVEKRLVDVICGDKTAGKYETEKTLS